ncbi:GNAT family N-acetyltransferase [Aminobacter carboxidus]|uniref:GNAT family N-acetyltransferase n=1 Tax=Aminobacter carboxidus TaxID=376165 RepID=A0ABR9GQ25_9HYPH|nr:GNAT family N-acetyltransferase [Aminobacter carboxidus]MBE1205783.1 GNAT family N-acetyltransferase [Aminobacter carboxidus]
MPEKAYSDEGLTAEARPATQEDAAILAKLVNMAGDGLPLYLWTKMAEDGEDPWEVGRRRAQREEGSFSYRNAVVLEHGKVIACLIGYPIVPSLPGPDTPAMFVPFNMLEAMAVGSWYVNVMATLPEARARGYGSRLLAMADTIAEATGCTGTSLIVSDANTAARHLYESVGYRAIASEPMVKEGWTGAGGNWVLMVKP